MNSARLLLLFLVIFSCCARGFAQDELVQWLLEYDAEFSDQNAAIDYLESLKRSPVPVNTADFSDLMRIPGLTPVQVQSVLNKKAEDGPFASLAAVRAAGNIPEDIFLLIAPYMTIAVPPVYYVDIRQRNQRDIDRSEAFSNNYYSGSILKSYTRARVVSSNGFDAGIILEKDPGEYHWSDHTALYLGWSSAENTRQFIAGSYSLDFAQGLLFSRFGNFGKSQEPIQPLIKRERGIRGYVSSNESEGMRGIASRMKSGRAEYIMFYSRSRRDAVINSDKMVTSIVRSGLHRSVTERNHEGALRETVYGSRFRLTLSERMSAGFTVSGIEYDRNFATDGPDEKLFSFSGNGLRIAGADFLLDGDIIQAFCEAGISDPGSHGLIAGTVVNLGSTRIGVLMREYAKDFYSPFGESFAEKSSEIRNEKGLYTGLKHRFNRYLSISSYADYFEFPWRTSSLPVSQKGAEHFFQIELRINPGNILMINWRRRSGSQRYSFLTDSGLEKDFIERAESDRCRIQHSYRTDRKISGSSRMELIVDRHPGAATELNERNTGYLISSRMNYRLNESAQAAAGAALFSDIENSHYVYEPDLPGLLTIKQLLGRGERMFVQYTCSAALLKLTVKYGITHYRDRSQIGSGSTRLNKNYKQEFGIQFDIAL
ncbi:ComEA family DNA-binding protein [candidate division KSB1 bacterium]